MLTSRRTRILGVGLLVAIACLAANPAWAATAAEKVASASLSAFDAIVLGVVEGVTEYLPISSTGHLLITARILDLPSAGKAGDAVKSYEIAIQIGAILAVLVLYWGRVREMFDGLIGRDRRAAASCPSWFWPSFPPRSSASSPRR